MLGVSLTHPVLVSLFISCVSLAHPMLALFLSGEFLLHIPCWLNFSVGSFSYTFHAGLIFLCGVSLTHPMTASFSNPGSFSYTSRALFIFICGISLKHAVLLHFYLWSFSYTSHADFVFMWGVSLTHPTMTSILSTFSFLFFSFYMWGSVSDTSRVCFCFFSGEFLLHIRCWLHFIWGVSLTHPMLA